MMVLMQLKVLLSEKFRGDAMQRLRGSSSSQKRGQLHPFLYIFCKVTFFIKWAYRIHKFLFSLWRTVLCSFDKLKCPLFQYLVTDYLKLGRNKDETWVLTWLDRIDLISLCTFTSIMSSLTTDLNESFIAKNPCPCKTWELMKFIFSKTPSLLQKDPITLQHNWLFVRIQLFLR